MTQYTPEEASYFQEVPRERLKLNPENPKLITEEAVEQMVTLLQVHGFRDPVEARHEDGLVLAGIRRLMASDRLGLTVIPTHFHIGMTDEQATAYTIAHTQAEAHVDWNRALLADQLSGLPEEYAPDQLGFSEKDVARLFDLDRGAEEAVGDGDGDPGGAVATVEAGEQWIIGPATFNVFENLDKSGLAKAEVLIRKISKLLKEPALLDGVPLDQVLMERAGR
jgi:ParB-like chromosome segregation protein Spo0J